MSYMFVSIVEGCHLDCQNGTRGTLGYCPTVATLYTFVAYRKLKETRKTNKRKDARDMMSLRDKYAGRSPSSAISSNPSTRIPEIMVNGQSNPEYGPVLGKVSRGIDIHQYCFFWFDLLDYNDNQYWYMNFNGGPFKTM
jgi:hypothetical protein